jgi:hypothetical protein
LISTTVEPARLDIARWAAGGSILSSVTYNVGVRNVHHERHEAVNRAWKWERYGRFIDAELSELALPGNRRASRRLARHHRDLGTLSPFGERIGSAALGWRRLNRGYPPGATVVREKLRASSRRRSIPSRTHYAQMEADSFATLVRLAAKFTHRAAEKL